MSRSSGLFEVADEPWVTPTARDPLPLGEASSRAGVRVGWPSWGLVVQVALVALLVGGGGSSPEGVLWFASSVVMMTLSVLGHELAHGWVFARRTGCSARVVTYGPLLGLTEPIGIDDEDGATDTPGAAPADRSGAISHGGSPWPLSAIMAGPAYNLVVGAAIFGLVRSSALADHALITDFLTWTAGFNLVVGVVNLVPVVPFDGGRLLVGLARRGGLVAAVAVPAAYTLGCGVAVRIVLALGQRMAEQGASLLGVVVCAVWCLAAVVSSVGVLAGCPSAAGPWRVPLHLVCLVIGAIVGWTIGPHLTPWIS